MRPSKVFGQLLTILGRRYSCRFFAADPLALPDFQFLFAPRSVAQMRSCNFFETKKSKAEFLQTKILNTGRVL